MLQSTFVIYKYPRLDSRAIYCRRFAAEDNALGQFSNRRAVLQLEGDPSFVGVHGHRRRVAQVKPERPEIHLKQVWSPRGNRIGKFADWRKTTGRFRHAMGHGFCGKKRISALRNLWLPFRNFAPRQCCSSVRSRWISSDEGDVLAAGGRTRYDVSLVNVLSVGRGKTKFCCQRKVTAKYNGCAGTSNGIRMPGIRNCLVSPETSWSTGAQRQFGGKIYLGGHVRGLCMKVIVYC